MLFSKPVNIKVELFENQAPNTVANFVNLAETGFYNGLVFHRVIEGFVAQGGDPNADGSGGPGYTINCECESPEARRHFYGSLSMAHAGKDTGGSQFFICLNRTSHLDGRHTVFGRVISGIDTLGKLTRTATMSQKIEGAEPDKIVKMTVTSKRDHEYKPVTSKDSESEEGSEESPPSQPTRAAENGEAASAESGEAKSEEDKN